MSLTSLSIRRRQVPAILLLFLLLCFFFFFLADQSSFPKSMGKRSCRLQQETIYRELEDVSSKEWEFIDMSEQEEDLIHRMYRLVGDRWGLIAGRVPGRKAEEIERFWIMSYGEYFAEKRLKREAGCSGRATS